MTSTMNYQSAAELLVVKLQFFQAASTLLTMMVIALLGLLVRSLRYRARLEQHIQLMRLEQQQLTLSEQAAKDYSANVSHEVQTSLASIQSFAEMLIEKNIANQQHCHYAEMIRAETMQLSALTDQLLFMSRLEHKHRAVTRRRYDVKNQLRRLLQLFEWQLTSKQIMGTIKAPDYAIIDADQVLMMQVWTNLLSNAIKHLEVGGVIVIEVSSDDEQCTVTISDTGEGIDEQHISQIFDRYYVGEQREDVTNTGLGLSIAQKIVDFHNGTIYLSSQKAVGTVAIVTIPHEYASYVIE